MNIKKLIYTGTVATSCIFASCQKGDLYDNPNAGTILNTSVYLNAITNRLYSGGGIIEGSTGAVSEKPWGDVNRYDQYYSSNYSYYQGTNTYNWSYSATHYDMLKYIILMEKQAATENPSATTTNIYAGLAKFFRAYSFIWLAQRVGDIPMDEAGMDGVLQPKFNTQKEVFKKSLALLDTANTIVGDLIKKGNLGNTVVNSTGDIFGRTYLQWQKVINTYKLRVLVSLSKRADDNADLNIKSQFAALLNNPDRPIMTGNTDNVTYRFNSVNSYPLFNNAYNSYGNICKTYLDLTTSNSDPRTFMVATPAPAQLSTGKSVGDFSAYVGADPNLNLAALAENSGKGQYSFMNYLRYYTSNTGANCEPFILFGYPEMCFNIAEGINRGWANGDAGAWYLKGIQASLATYGLTQGQLVNIGNFGGSVIGTTTVDISTFLSKVAYTGGSGGLRQILEQKYVAMFNNSGWEAFYNYRRTGVPAFAQGGAGIGSSNNQIPRRWQYPLYEINENSTHYQSAIQSQFGGSDDVMKDTWLTK